ncbi:hypothetical protein AVEN_269449-1 [Araneus ventricosus]|uniref:Uncharacterized protein n=1 Tax=Araneus ventricosus TaxID=182803 RepID=A0A4Y2M5F4_ARAVE|nr:hypothetical protein AVEN_269449-1 [Araneus ventricosus]
MLGWRKVISECHEACNFKGARWASGKFLVSGGEPQAGNPISLNLRRVWDLLYPKSYEMIKLPTAGVVRRIREGVKAQVLTS